MKKEFGMQTYHRGIKLLTVAFCICLCILGRPANVGADTQENGGSKPQITGVSKEVLVKEYKSTVNLYKGVKAKNASGSSLTSDLIVKVRAPGTKSYKTAKQRKLVLNAAGTYKVMYYVKDAASGLSAKTYKAIESRDTKAPVITSEDKFAASTLKAGTTSITYKSLMKGIHASLISGKNMTAQVGIRINDPQGNKATVTKNKSYEFSEPGTYVVTYMCGNPNVSLKTGTMLITKKVRNLVLPDPISYQLVVPKDSTLTATGGSINLNKKVYVAVTDASKSKSNVTKVTEGIKVQVKYMSPEGEAKTVKVTDGKLQASESEGKYLVTYSYTTPKNEKLTYTRTITMAVQA